MASCDVCKKDGGVFVKVTVCKWCDADECLMKGSEEACVCPDCASNFCASNVKSLLLKVILYHKSAIARGSVK